MRSTRVVMGALIGIVLPLLGCKEATVALKHHPAKVADTVQKGIRSVTLDARAAERTGIETTQIREEMVNVGSGTAMRKVVPYGGIMYDTKGATWMFTNPEPLMFVRQSVVVENIVGDRVILSEGPPTGTVVVTVGAAELMGAEHKYGD